MSIKPTDICNQGEGALGVVKIEKRCILDSWETIFSILVQVSPMVEENKHDDKRTEANMAINPRHRTNLGYYECRSSQYKFSMPISYRKFY